MIFPNGYLILVIVSLIFCSLGFFHFIWFMSVGYGLSAAGIGLTLLIMSIVRNEFDLIYTLQCIALMIYGIRLGGFLLFRELKNEKYRQKMAEVGGYAKVPFFVKIIMWLFLGVLYVVQSSGPVYRLLNGTTSSNHVSLIIGIVVSVIGIVLESEADKQKSAEKVTNPDMPAMHGLYKMCRCPNYLGEIIFWTGNLISSIGILKGYQVIVTIIGYIAVLIIMTSAVKRVETRHIKHYGDIPEYNAYADNTPLIIPLIPFYHITSKEKIKATEAKKK